MDGLIILIYALIALTVIIGVFAMNILNKVDKKYPTFVNHFIYEELDRDGNPIEEEEF